ncbi:flavoprotein [Clostridium sp. W14A]|uniref:Flavodoxin family protein n=1 Tax=Caproicibacter fermentans TaxID=2576756 RepID=A0A7G8T716_9FIRM|nr:flavodoxin family protein [Caproicibacter fermentans]OCN01678.1 flavoprotein [Clostridium sp. W14A]QNK39407.1 flavodoxin family protein [Caproicibacter fermentans]
MKLIIHDLTPEQAETILPKQSGIRVISDNGKIRHCVGCFGCWVKTPGQCVIHDGYETVSALLAQCEELILISRCFYGGFSPFVKNVVDRNISYSLPDFTIRNGEMHHKGRYDNRFKLSVCFYGENMTETERQTARELVQANTVNLNGTAGEVHFAERAEDFKGVLS